MLASRGFFYFVAGAVRSSGFVLLVVLCRLGAGCCVEEKKKESYGQDGEASIPAVKVKVRWLSDVRDNRRAMGGPNSSR